MQPQPGCGYCRGMNACGIGVDEPLEGRGAKVTPGPGKVQNVPGRGDGVRLFFGMLGSAGIVLLFPGMVCISSCPTGLQALQHCCLINPHTTSLSRSCVPSR